jgi:uncharacterized membrane protein
MVLAAQGDTGYNIFLLLHIVTGFVAFAPAVFVHPVMWMSRREDSRFRGRILTWSMILTGVFGFGVVGMSDEVFSLGDGWVLAAIVVWVAMNGVLHAVLLPAERAWGAGDDSAEVRLQNASSAITLLMLVMIYLMVFKPGA